MPILNYTTSVPASRSIGQIQSLLVKGGARAIMSEYDDTGCACGISFSVLQPQEGQTKPSGQRMEATYCVGGGSIGKE